MNARQNPSALLEAAYDSFERAVQHAGKTCDSTYELVGFRIRLRFASALAASKITTQIPPALSDVLFS